MTTRTVRMKTPGGRTLTLARFELEGDTVRAAWSDPIYQRELERNGIFNPETGERLTLEHGASFLEALHTAYSRSSTITISR